MSNIRFLYLILIIVATSTAAQGMNSYDGVWSAKYVGTNGVNWKGRLEVHDDGGTWIRYSENQSNHCIGRPYPIAVTKKTDTELEYVIRSSSMIVGCDDLTVTMRHVDANTLEAKGPWGSFTLVRQ